MRVKVETLFHRTDTDFSANTSKIFNQIFGDDYTGSDFVIDNVKSDTITLDVANGLAFSWKLVDNVPDVKKVCLLHIYANQLSSNETEAPVPVSFDTIVDSNNIGKVSQVSFINASGLNWDDFEVGALIVATGKKANLTIVIGYKN